MWSPNRLRSAGLTIHFTANLNEFTISFRKQYVWIYVPWNYCWRRKTPTSEWRKLICSRKNGTKPYDRRIHMNQLIIPPKNQRFFYFYFLFFFVFPRFQLRHPQWNPSRGSITRQCTREYRLDVTNNEDKVPWHMQNLLRIIWIPSLKLRVRTWKWMVGRRSFPFGARPIFRGEMLVSGRVSPTGLMLMVMEQRVAKRWGWFAPNQYRIFSGWWFFGSDADIQWFLVWRDDDWWMILFLEWLVSEGSRMIRNFFGCKNTELGWCSPFSWKNTRGVESYETPTKNPSFNVKDSRHPWKWRSITDAKRMWCSALVDWRSNSRDPTNRR